MKKLVLRLGYVPAYMKDNGLFRDLLLAGSDEFKLGAGFFEGRDPLAFSVSEVADVDDETLYACRSLCGTHGYVLLKPLWGTTIKSFRDIRSGKLSPELEQKVASLVDAVRACIEKFDERAALFVLCDQAS